MRIPAICRCHSILPDLMSPYRPVNSGRYLNIYLNLINVLICSKYLLFIYFRLLYQSRKRGMLENDLLLSTFVAKYLKDFNAEQTALYDDLINGVSNDWDIFYWATETKPTPPEYDTEIMKMLKQHVKNAERVQRIRQPDL